MLFLTLAKFKSIIDHKKYCEEIIAKYDSYMKILNDDNQPELTIDVFHEFGIFSIKDLGKYLKQNSEYGGCVHMSWSQEAILIPFHNDFMNSWLRFDNPRVIEFYNDLYDSVKEQYDSRVHFDMKKFDVEENLQINNWIMPPLDRRMLSAPISGCWDQPELVARFLELQGYKTKRLCCHDGHAMRGHCFTVYTDGTYWMTAASLPLNIKTKDYNDLCRKVYKILKHVPIYSDNSKCRLVEFDPPVPGMTAKEYVANIENGRIVVDYK